MPSGEMERVLILPMSWKSAAHRTSTHRACLVRAEIEVSVVTPVDVEDAELVAVERGDQVVSRWEVSRFADGALTGHV